MIAWQADSSTMWAMPEGVRYLEMTRGLLDLSDSSFTALACEHLLELGVRDLMHSDLPHSVPLMR